MKQRVEVLFERVMTRVYADLIEKGVQTLSNVPEHLQSDVSTILSK
jgi:hypothetical protein